jgi:hypothetical protein
MAIPAEIEQYNYSTFVDSENLLLFGTALQVGSAAPDFIATMLEGE